MNDALFACLFNNLLYYFIRLCLKIVSGCVQVGVAQAMLIM